MAAPISPLSNLGPVDDIRQDNAHRAGASNTQMSGGNPMVSREVPAHAAEPTSWWERHDGLIWTVATALEIWQWPVGFALLVLFSLTGGAP